MTKERKDKVIESLLDWKSEVVSDDGEYYNTLKNSIGLSEREIKELGISIEPQEEEEIVPLEVGGGSVQEKIFAIVNDYCDMSERMYGGTEDMISASMLAEHIPCSVEELKEHLDGYVEKAEGDTIWLNDAVLVERRKIRERPNYSEFVSNLRKKYFARNDKLSAENYMHECLAKAIREKVIASVENEFAEFKNEFTLNHTAEDVFESAHMINIKRELYGTIIGEFGETYLSDKEYGALAHERDSILENLYTDFICEEGASVNSFADTARFIEDYCERNYPEISSVPVNAMVL